MAEADDRPLAKSKIVVHRLADGPYSDAVLCLPHSAHRGRWRALRLRTERGRLVGTYGIEQNDDVEPRFEQQPHGSDRHVAFERLDPLRDHARERRIGLCHGANIGERASNDAA